MAGTETIVKGFARDIARQILRRGVPYGGDNASPFLGTDALAPTLWRGDEQVSLASPTAAWLDATGDATYSIGFAASDTSPLAPGVYRVETALTRSGETGVIDRFGVTLLPSPGTPGAATVASPVAVSQGNALARLATVYCTDESIALRAPFDYAALCPRDQNKASGLDGVFHAASPWVLTSASVNFLSLGVAANDVVVLSRPPSQFKSPAVFAVDSVASGSVTLRRPGGYLGEGQPPAPTAGLNGVGFDCLTFRPQVDDVSFDINEEWGIDPARVGMHPGNLYDPRELRNLAVLTVLQRAYVGAMKSESGDYKLKLALVSSDLDALKARLSLRWGASGQDRPTATRFNTRIVR